MLGACGRYEPQVLFGCAGSWFDRRVKNVIGIVVLAALVAACGKKDSGGAGTASGSAVASAARDAAGVSPDASAPPAVRADVAAFAAVFEPVSSRLDHVARARSGCEQRQAFIDAAKAIDAQTPPAGRDADAWRVAVETLQGALDELGDPCDEGNIKAIEAQLDSAKKALDTLTKG